MALTSLQAPAKICFILINILQKYSHNKTHSIKFSTPDTMRFSYLKDFDSASLLNLLDTLTKDKSYNHPYHILHEIW